MADGSLSGLNWPLVSLQCDHTPLLKRYGLFPFFVFQNAETRKIAFGLFNGPDLL
jgi:hypothetical protein